MTGVECVVSAPEAASIWRSKLSQQKLAIRLFFRMLDGGTFSDVICMLSHIAVSNSRS